MNLMALVNRIPDPAPWSEGDNIPWHDPDFSRRMLKEHLSQDHDAASRRFEKIDEHVGWIHEQILSNRATKILDLGCGPGLYSSGLSRLGHRCVGIDYSPASIDYAVEHAENENLDCVYLNEDIRTAEYGTGFGLAMLIYGEFNIFRPEDVRHILRKANKALVSGGQLLLESHTYEVIQRMAKERNSWSSAKHDLFLDRPHIYLEESMWNPGSNTTTTRFFIIDASAGEVTRYAQSFQAYTDEEYRSVLTECGFSNVRFFPSLTGTEDESQRGLMAILAQKQD